MGNKGKRRGRTAHCNVQGGMVMNKPCTSFIIGKGAKACDEKKN